MTKGDSSRVGDGVAIFICLLGIIVAFMSIFKYAQKAQPVSAVWAGGIWLFFFTFLLATKLAKVRQRKE